MRIVDRGPRPAVVEAARRARPSLRLNALAACALALAGCETLVPVAETTSYGPRTDTALLTPLPPPKCGARPTRGGGADAEKAEKLRRLDYEAQCYRHAEMIARNRLSKLQTSVRKSAAKARKQPTTVQRVKKSELMLPPP